MLLTVIVLLAMGFTLNSCKKSSDTTTTPPVIILDGFYIKGAGTAYNTLNDKAMMKVTRNEVIQATRGSLFELYIPVKAGTDGFNIVQIAGSVTRTYGPGTDFATVTPTTDEPKDTYMRGALVQSTNKFTVPTDGMYHIVFDTVVKKVALAKVTWGVIGASTPGGWTTGTAMTASAFNLTDMSWTKTLLTLTKGQWKFRYSDGWKIFLDTVEPQTGGKKGVTVNTNFGYKVDSLVPGGDNINLTVQGVYTISMAYKLGSGYTATLTKTGDVPPVDYSTFNMGIIGNCYKVGGVQANWDNNFDPQLPVVTGGTTYTWTYIIPIDTAGDFKFRQGSDWSGKSIGYTDVTMAGAQAGNFSNDGGNFKVTITGTYTLVLVIDAVTENYTLTATLAKKD